MNMTITSDELDNAFDDPTIELRIVWSLKPSGRISTAPPGPGWYPTSIRQIHRYLIEVGCEKVD